MHTLSSPDHAAAAPDGPAVPTLDAIGARLRDALTPDETPLFARLEPAKFPRHVAVIMDGNGRWARQRGLLDRIRGHEAGIDSVRAVTRACSELGLSALTLYAFSSENWQRPKRETGALMKLLERFLIAEIPELMRGNVRLEAMGTLTDLPDAAQRALAQARAATAGNTGLVLNLALSYGGRAELTSAVRALAAQVARGELAPDAITEAHISGALYQPALGDPELLVRTSGEVRVSNFMLYQIAYTEIHVTPVLWPDFRRAHLYTALLDFATRQRRFGRVSDDT